MQPPFPAYRGNEPYIFVSYAHADKAVVYPEIQLLHERGCRIWFDEGITPGERWTREIAQAIERCRFFMLFMTPRAADSEWVYREIEFAAAERKPFLAIYLEQTTLSAELRWLIGPVQAILKHDIGHVTYLEKLGRAVPEETLNSPESSARDRMPDEKPAKAKTTVRKKSAESRLLNHSARQGAKHSSPRYDSLLSVPLLEASRTGKLGTVKELLAKGADPNAHTRNGWTALMSASSNGHLEVARLLLAKGASPNPQRADGWTALMLAAGKGHFEIAQLLLKKGALPDVQTTDGWTALMGVASRGHLGVAQMLLEKGALPNAQTRDGWTALMSAASNGQQQMFWLLLRGGADPRLLNVQGKTAVDVADRSIQSELARITGVQPSVQPKKKGIVDTVVNYFSR